MCLNKSNLTTKENSSSLRQKLKDIYVNMHDVTSKQFILFLSIVFSLFFIGTVLYILSIAGHPSAAEPSPIDKERDIVGHILLVLGLALISLYVNDEKKIRNALYFLLSGILLGIDFLYLRWLKPSIGLDILLTFLTLISMSYLIYTMLIFMKALKTFIHYILSKILATSCTGLRSVIEQITSLILSASALVGGIVGFIAVCKSIFDVFSHT